ncbi:uncharacterized protein [Physcomitrium patens]|uniref:uncharacterized protein isoform X3 n=1 Tax=Physcomitrium patens TaxID=3218 RepID=UPI003CCD2C43
MLFAAGQRGSLNAVTSSAITPGGNPAMDWVGIEEPPCWNVDKRCEGVRVSAKQIHHCGGSLQRVGSKINF